MKKILFQAICMFIIGGRFAPINGQVLPPFNGGTWAGDTIICNFPIGGIGAGGSRTPSKGAAVTAVFRLNNIVVTVESENLLAASIFNNEGTIYFRETMLAHPTTPAIINITDLPPGHYTLRLYINNECLEGEFEKE